MDCFIIVLLSFRMVSLASMSAAVSMPIVLYVLRTFFDYHASDLLFYFSILIAFLIIFTHRSNIKRILNGSENKISLKKRAS
jgi:glycerol-3-phosphate acyltransferase PlsY